MSRDIACRGGHVAAGMRATSVMLESAQSGRVPHVRTRPKSLHAGGRSEAETRSQEHHIQILNRIGCPIHKDIRDGVGAIGQEEFGVDRLDFLNN